MKLKFFFMATALFLCSEKMSAQVSIPDQVTDYETLQRQIAMLDSATEQLHTEVIGHSVEGRNIVALKFSSGVFGADAHKLKVLLFAQQHGNEQSGKEGALLLANWLADTSHHNLFDKLDIALIPQVNPDGAVVNKRRNGNNADLNRNHLILTEPETKALHHFFDKYLFEVTLDVHEYSPYGEDWKQYGYRKNTDVALGSCTNPNVASGLRAFSDEEVLPFIMNRLQSNGFKSFVYCPGGPPEVEYIRHSTFDINDGRQSFGIQQTLSFIQEGMNGTDMFSQNMAFRARGQMEGMLSLLLFTDAHAAEIRELVHASRLKLFNHEHPHRLSVQAMHMPNGDKLQLPLFSYHMGIDTIVEVTDYRPVVRSITDVDMPVGYLIPKEDVQLIAWANRHDLLSSALTDTATVQFEQYFIHAIDSIDFEGDMVADAMAERQLLKSQPDLGNYQFYPTNQLKGRMLAIALEPKSMLGLITYPLFKQLLVPGKFYPVLRVVRKPH